MQIRRTLSSNYDLKKLMVLNWFPKVTPVDNNWNALAYGPAHIIALASTGTGNRFMKSVIGSDVWTIGVSAADNNWTAVCYAESLNMFIAVANSGTGNRVMTTAGDTPTTWTIRTSAANNNWTGVAFGNGIAVAVGNTAGVGNKIMTSPTGVTWTLRNAPADISYNDVCFGNGLFVAVAGSGTDRVMTSTDGITWTAINCPTTAGWSKVNYVNGLFVASGSSSYIMVSPDGVNWTLKGQVDSVASPPPSISRVAFGNGIYLVATSALDESNRGMIYYSFDLSTWYKKSLPTSSNPNAQPLYVNNHFVICTVGSTGYDIMYSLAMDVI